MPPYARPKIFIPILLQQNLGVRAEIVLKAAEQSGGWRIGAGGRGCRESGEWRGEQAFRFGAVGGGQAGEPFLLHRVAFVAGETVEAFEINEVGSGAFGKGGQGGAQERGDGRAAFVRPGVAGDERSKRGGEAKRFVAPTDAVMTGDEP